MLSPGSGNGDGRERRDPLREPRAPAGEDWIVQLRYATLPRPLSVLAIHHWFVLFDPRDAIWRRWEVWQDPDRGGTSWGHVHRDLMHPDRPVGGGPCVVEREWTGEEARRLTEVMEASPSRYPFPTRYRAWPGPNSNTYAAWVLEQARISHSFDPRAIGSGYMPTGGALRVGSPLAGIRVQAGRAAEILLLCLTFGVEVDPLALRTPFGRVPLPRRLPPTGEDPCGVTAPGRG